MADQATVREQYVRLFNYAARGGMGSTVPNFDNARLLLGLSSEGGFRPMLHRLLVASHPDRVFQSATSAAYATMARAVYEVADGCLGIHNSCKRKRLSMPRHVREILLTE